MKMMRISVVAIAFALAGCASEPPPLTELPEPDPATAHADYWLAQPGAASVFDPDYDKLWDACGNVARAELFDLDRQDYRDGVLTTHPLISKQLFEFWRPDSGDDYAVWQNSLQTIRRTIEFQFDKLPGGAAVTPKVVVERLSKQNKRITSSAEYRRAFARPGGGDNDEYWYAIGRDLVMEAKLATSIKGKL